jgi:isoquinoline 1-oxidoreductase subunit alpha
LLRKTPSPSDGEIKQALEGNICRCGTYNRIVSAVRQASQSMKTASRESDHA